MNSYISLCNTVVVLISSPSPSRSSGELRGHFRRTHFLVVEKMPKEDRTSVEGKQKLE